MKVQRTPAQSGHACVASQREVCSVEFRVGWARLSKSAVFVSLFVLASHFFTMLERACTPTRGQACIVFCSHNHAYEWSIACSHRPGALLTHLFPACASRGVC